MCGTWAAAGECTKNPGFMIGSATAPGACRRACKACLTCDPSDPSCYNANRANAGYLVFNETELLEYAHT